VEKKKPHYKLTGIQSIVADSTSRPFTVTALRGGLELGLDEQGMRAVVLKLKTNNFYKSMTTHSDNKIWQDVYHGLVAEGIGVYIKITAYTDARPPVIQFKRK
jgi:motility quorum-sensing regulator / GCU-specific mRNA interferase toxin